MNTIQFGYHLTIDLYGCPENLIESSSVGYEVLLDLVKILEMKALCPPNIIPTKGNTEFGGKDPGGYTGFIIIAESHISIHSFVKRGFVSMDLYSCKQFDEEKAIDFIKKTFKPKEIELHKIDRGLNYPVDNIY